MVQTICLYEFSCRGTTTLLGAFQALVGQADEEVVAASNTCAEGKWFLSPMPYSVFTSFLSFVIVFRCNNSLSRYWEARTSVAQASARWMDACMQLILLDEGLDAVEASGETLAWRQRILHLFSLLHAVASNYLRDDLDLENLVDFSNPLLKRRACVEDFHRGGFFPDILHARGHGSNTILLSQNLASAEHAFRRSNPLFNFLWYSWGPATNRLVARALPLPVIGGVSNSERRALEVTPERVRLVTVWIHRAIMARSATADGFMVPVRPSETIGSASPSSHTGRCLGLIADGVTAWSHARKIVDSPFPFPHAHMVAIALIIFSFSCPLVMVSWCGSLWSAVLMDALAVTSFWALNEVSVDLEDPFVGPPNNIPLCRLHATFHEELHTFAAQYITALQEQQGASDPSALDPVSVLAAKHAARAAGSALDMRAVLSGSVYAAVYRHMLPIPKAAAGEETRLPEPPDSPRVAFTRYYA